VRDLSKFFTWINSFRIYLCGRVLGLGFDSCLRNSKQEAFETIAAVTGPVPGPYNILSIMLDNKFTDLSIWFGFKLCI